MSSRGISLALAGFLLSGGFAMAHTTLTYPTGGSTFLAGTVVQVTWSLDVPHNQLNWDLYFSSDGGSSWTNIARDLPLSQLSFDWTVPAIPTIHARLKIVQDNTVVDYESQCTDFQIRLSTTASEWDIPLPEEPFLEAPYPNPFQESFSVVFHSSTACAADLQLYDMTGRLASEARPRPRNGSSSRSIFDTRSLAPGSYLVVAQCGNAVNSRIVVKS